MDPRIHFVLSSHNKCSPCLRLIEPNNLDDYLTAATKEYLEQFVSISFTKRQVNIHLYNNSGCIIQTI